MKLAAVLLFITFLFSCAQIPEYSVDEEKLLNLTCSDLATQEKETIQMKEIASKAKNDSWQAILPFIVAARYGQASSSYSEAERRLILIQEIQINNGCMQTTIS
jgi:hypothetical protein